MKQKIFTLKIAGPAGKGIKSSGRLLSQMLVASGFYTHDYTEYPSLVRGGHNTYQVSFSSQKVTAPQAKVDFFFSLEPEHWRNHLDEIKKGGVIFAEINDPRVKYLPLRQLAQKAGHPLSANIVCLGIAAFIFRLQTKRCLTLLRQFFGSQSKINTAAFQLGYRWAQNHSLTQPKYPSLKKKKLELYDGNEAFGWGFLKGKGNFYAAYPMTPATGLLHFLAARQKQFKITVRHPEDEIAAANLAVGAAFAGARAAVGTSGGGFALMNETISLGGMAEIGTVYYLVQRVAPATGMPTWTAQSDLLHAIFSGHGEFPKVVLAPGDQQESFIFAWQALNLAENLQTPIIVLSDKFLAESSASITPLTNQKVKIDRGKLITKKPPSPFKRYDWHSRCGRSWRTLPGLAGGEFLANSYEHDQEGFSTEEAKTAQKMAQKRMRKLKTALRLTPKPKFFGNQKPEKLIISWGSTKGSILAAMKKLNQRNLGFLQIRTLWPLHPEIRKTIEKAKETWIVENNQTSQLTTLLKTQFNFQPTKKVLKFNGRPFFPEELYEQFR